MNCMETVQCGHEMAVLSLVVMLCCLVQGGTLSLAALPEHHPCRVTWDKTKNGSVVDCSHLDLQDIPENLPGDTVILNFRGNDLATLKNASFVRFPRLMRLVLAYCRLTSIQMEAFKGLNHLRSLRLDHNHLLLDKSTYHKDLFRPLKQLTEIDLRFNDPRLTGNTPDEIFSNLGNLENLALDTFKDEIFGIGFVKLTKLKTLTLSAGSDNSHYCGITTLKNDTFTVFENASIENLDLDNCLLYGIETGVFVHLSSVSTIKMNNVKNLPISTAFRSLYGLNGRNVTALLLKHFFWPHPIVIKDVRKQIIDDTITGSLRDMCIETIDLSHNEIIYIDKSFILTFSKCLKYLDASHNHLVGNILILPFLSFAKRLEFFDISYQLSSASFSEQNKELHITHLSGSSYNGVNFPLPPLITEFKARSIATNFGVFGVSRMYGSEHLMILDLADNGIKEMHNHILGLEKVEKIDLSMNEGSGMTENFLTSFEGVKELVLREMGFDENALSPEGPVFLGLRKLMKITSLDLTGNNIRFLREDFFNPFSNITKLYLSQNGFVSLPVDLNFVPKLTHLDLSSNSITFLQDEETEKLEILGQKKNFILMLSGNPFSCSCQSLTFIRWLYTTKVTLDKGGNYTCVTEDGVLTSTARVNEEFNLHWTSCQSHFWLPFAITMMSLIALIIVTMLLVKLNWTRIQHHLMVALGKGVKRVKREDFKKDVYIAHCDSYEDFKFVNGDLKFVLEDKYQLRLILPDRDFLCGHYVADNVVDSVNKSWKTVLVATEEFLSDPWSHFIMKTAAYAVSDVNPNRVIILLLGNVNRGKVPKDILNVTEEDDIFQVDELPHAKDDVWQALKDRIVRAYP